MSYQVPGNKQQKLQLMKRADGSARFLGLLPGQKIIKMLNGHLLLEKPDGSRIPLSMIITKPTDTESQEPASQTFFVGDQIRLDPEFALERIQSRKRNASEEAIRNFVEATVGTVSCANSLKITVKFPYLGGDIFFHFDPPSFRFVEKLNTYSINQLIKMKSDVLTVAEMKKKFQHHEQIKGAIGEVIGIDLNDPSGQVVIRFDDPEIQQLFPSNSVPLPSVWMDPFLPTNPTFNKKFLDLASTEVALFLRVVDGGDLRTAQQLYNRRGVDAKARNVEGMIALHIACLKGHCDIVQWLLVKAKVNVNNPDYKGYCSVHYAALGGQTKILELLKAHKADPNIQDAEGNTALHVAVMKRKGVDGLMRTFNPKLGLRNDEGFNAIQLAVVSNNFEAVKSILANNELCEPLLEFMPNRRSTILHQICADKNYQMAKLLLDESNDIVLVERQLLLKKLLETKDEIGSTALLIASKNKDYAMVELLVDSGADVKSVDRTGHTAILMAALSSAPEETPSKELSPAIFKLYESALGDNAEIKTMMESHPILSLVAYLMKNGCPLEAANKDGIIGSNVVMGLGSPASVITKMLGQFLVKSLAEASCGSICMGKSGCTGQPELRLYCPHKPSYTACSKCILLHVPKCGCSEENIVSIHSPVFQQLLDLSRYQKEKPVPISQPELASFTFEWVQGTGNGYLCDQMGNKYTYVESDHPGVAVCRRFRCDKGPNYKERCTAVALAIKDENSTGGIFPDVKFTFCLEKPHSHPVALKRKIIEGSCAGPSSSKKGRKAKRD